MLLEEKIMKLWKDYDWFARGEDPEWIYKADWDPMVYDSHQLVCNKGELKNKKLSRKMIKMIKFDSILRKEAIKRTKKLIKDNLALALTSKSRYVRDYAQKIKSENK